MSDNLLEIREDKNVAEMIAKSMDGETSIEFIIHDKVIVGMYEDGSIYVNGRLAETDKELVEGMRQVLKLANNL